MIDRCQDLGMRLTPGITLAYADDVLRRAETTWGNARGAQDYYRAYTDAVHDTYPTLRQAFAAPDLGASLHSTAYWNLLPIGGASPDLGFTTDPAVAANRMRALRAENQALATEIENQVKALEQARAEIEELKKLAARPGLPVVYDTMPPSRPVARRANSRLRGIAALGQGLRAYGGPGGWADTEQMADDDEAVRLPLVLGPVSNGEFLPLAASPTDIRLARAVLDRAAAAADALRLGRREFLHTAGGMAALLTTINLAACSSPRGTTARPSPPGGSYRTPPPEQLPECRAALGSRGEFIVDVHTHHLMPSLPWRRTAPNTLRLVLDMVPPDCTAANPLTCVDRAAYLHDMFLASDTTVALLSDLPSTGESNDPLPFSAADDTWQLASSLTGGGQSRLLLQNVIAPNFGSLAERLDGMTAAAETRRVAAFKVYTAWGPGGRGFDLDDPSVGLPVVQHAHDLGVNVLCAHKGLPLLNFASTWNQPRDMVAVSRQFPGMQFVVYHAGWTPQHAEGPYNPADPTGVDSLIWALNRYKVQPNSNVWADVATVWRSLLAVPDQAAHVLGKLLSRLGEDRVLWGTDSVWYGPPQTQIMAFRAFEISAEFQHRYGYPALTDTVKSKVLGLNAARLWGLDPHATRCALATDALERNRSLARSLADVGELPASWVPRGPVTRGQMLHWLARETGPWIPA